MSTLAESMLLHLVQAELLKEHPEHEPLLLERLKRLDGNKRQEHLQVSRPACGQDSRWHISAASPVLLACVPAWMWACFHSGRQSRHIGPVAEQAV